MTSKPSSCAVHCLLLASAISFGSCKMKEPDLHSLNKTIVPNQYSAHDLLAKQKKMTQHWWKELHNQELDKLIEKALDKNFTIKSAHSRLRQSQAIAKVGGSSRYPQVNGSLSGFRTKSSINSGLSGFQTSSSINSGLSGFQTNSSINRFAVGLSVSYEIDFAGRIKNQIEALDYNVMATQEDISTAIISVASQITKTWYRLHDSYLQKRDLDQVLSYQTKDVQFVKDQYKNGLTPIDALWQKQQAKVNSTKARLQIESNIKTLENSMAVLLGNAPGSYRFTFKDTDLTLSAPPAIGIPLDLIQSRPDIRKAYFDLLAADKNIAVAIKDRFPKLSLSVSTETSEAKVSNLFKNWFSSLAGNLLAPLIDGGRRKAEVEKQRATYQLLLNQYGKVVITAIKEVEDALIIEKTKAALLQNNQELTTLAKKTALITQSNYRANQVSLSIYYQAQINHLNSYQQLYASQRELIEARVDLYKALANSWSIKKNSLSKKY